MDKQKLVVLVMGQNCEKFIGMCMESIKDADEIIYCDGGSTDNTILKIQELFYKVREWRLIGQEYNQEDKQMNGKQRNFYLKFLKENYINDWCLCLDADEVVEDIQKVKKFIQGAPEGLYSVHMRHFIGNLGHEDATNEVHYVPNRLFKINEADYYPEIEHPVLQCKFEKKELIPNHRQKGGNYAIMNFAHPNNNENIGYMGQTNCTTIWHLAYIPNLWEIKKRYENHMKKSTSHTPEFLKQWKDWHIFGSYPKKEVNPVEIPNIILKEFNVNKDEFYFANRTIDLKHPIMVKEWYDYFKPKDVLDLGCGRGPYLFFWEWFVELCSGVDISKYAVDNKFCKSPIYNEDISESHVFAGGHDLITAIDVLEHLEDEQLDKTLKKMAESGEKFIFSIPFIGDPNLMNDKTHKQFMTKEEWINKIEYFGIKINETPKNWHFSNQILVGKI